MRKLILLSLLSAVAANASRGISGTGVLSGPTTDLPLTGSVSIKEMHSWSQNDGNYHILFETYATGSSTFFQILKGADNTLYAAWGFSNGEQTASRSIAAGGYTLNTGSWNVITATWDAGVQYPVLYLNGTALGSGVGVGSGSASTSPHAWVFGNRFDGSFPWTGTIADIGVWNVVLTSGQVATLNVCGNHPSSVPGGLVNEWDLTGSSLNAQQGGVNLTATGTTTQSDPSCAGSFTVNPTTIPANHSGNITLSLAGTGTSWTSSTRFTLSGVSGIACAATPCVPTVSSGTAATVVLTSTSGSTGTLTVTESVTGSSTGTTTVATATLGISPIIGNIGTTPTLTLTGTNTIWSAETAAGLFSVSGGSGSSIGTPAITTNTAGTVTLTVGSTAGTLTITDHSTGATASFTATGSSFTVTPATIPAHHAGNITLSLVGTGTSWSNGTRFALSGVSGVTCSTGCTNSPNVTDSTHVTIVVTTGASGTGTLTLTESVTGSNTSTTTVATAGFTISPTSGATNTSPTLALTGTNTLWSTEIPSGLFTITGGTGASIGSPAISTNTAGTVALTTGTASGTITITDTSTTATQTFTVSSVPLVVTFPSANVYQSPYTWRNSGGAAICPNSGYMLLKVTGTTAITLNVDTTYNNGLSSNQMPFVKVRVDTPAADGAYSTIQFPANNTASTPLTLATGLSAAATYTVRLQFHFGDINAGNGWSATTLQMKLNSLQFDSGATLSAPTLQPKNCVAFGDSYFDYFGGTISGPLYNYTDFTQSWPSAAFGALNCEGATIGVAGQGWVNNSAGGGYPIFGSSWNYYDSTHAKTFLPAPDYAFVAVGTNDHGQSTATLTSNITSTLAAMRTAFGAGTKIFAILPIMSGGSSFTPAQVTAFKAGVTNAADPLVYVVDPGTTYANIAFAPGNPVTWASPDGLHLTPAAQGIIGDMVIKAAQAAEGGTVAGVSSVVVQ